MIRISEVLKIWNRFPRFRLKCIGLSHSIRETDCMIRISGGSENLESFPLVQT